MQEEFEAELPVDADGSDATGNGPLASFGADFDARLTMRDVILIKRGSKVKVGKTRKGHFTTRYTPKIGGAIDLPVDRGWTSVEARVGERKFRFINTHLEAFGDPKIREAQAKELTKGPLKTNTQVVLVGDLNSGIRRHNEPEKQGDDLAFKALDRFGFKDNGARQSCCFDSLFDPNATFDHTVDHVLTKPGLTTTKASVTGRTQSERTPSGLWPSDHGGVVSQVRLRRQLCADARVPRGGVLRRGARRAAATRGSVARFAQVVDNHEATHVATLKGVLGAKAVKQPSFDFKGTTRKWSTFLRTAKVLEDTGVAAYQGQAPLIHQNAVLGPAGAILAVEARHAAWVRDLLYAGKRSSPRRRRSARRCPCPTSWARRGDRVHQVLTREAIHMIFSQPTSTCRTSTSSTPTARSRRPPRRPSATRAAASCAPRASCSAARRRRRRDARLRASPHVQGRRRDPQLRAHARVPRVRVLRVRARSTRA